MGYRRCTAPMGAARSGPSHGAAFGLPHGWGSVRDADELRQGHRNARRRRRHAHDRGPANVQASCPSGIYDFLDLAVHPHDPHLERRRRTGLSVPTLPDRANAAHTSEGACSIVTVTVNGIAVEVARWPSPTVAAVRELLRQRAVALGFLAPEVIDDDEIGAAIERLLSEEVVVPSPTEAECQRYYDTHLKEFWSGDLVHARHILFQVTPSTSVPEIRGRAERTLSELLAKPDKFTAVARELSNCPSGQQGGNLGQIGRGETVPEFERALFRLGASGILPELVKTRHGFHIVAVDQSIPGKTLPFEAARDQIADRLKASVEERALKQYVSILAGQAEVVGVDLAGARTPLVQ